MEQILDFMRGVYTQHFSEICVMILGCIFVLMIMNLFAVKRCRRQVKETAKRTEGMLKMYFEQLDNPPKLCYNKKGGICPAEFYRKGSLTNEKKFWSTDMDVSDAGSHRRHL